MRAEWRKVIIQGLVVGVIGFATVAVVLAVANIIAGRSPLFTSALLGAALRGTVTDPVHVSVSVGNVLVYTILHLGVFLAFGIVAAALAAIADRGRQLWYISLFFFLFFSFHLVAAVQSLATPVRAELSDAVIWVVGFAASGAMAGYLLRRHPRIRARQPW